MQLLAAFYIFHTALTVLMYVSNAAANHIESAIKRFRKRLDFTDARSEDGVRLFLFYYSIH